MKPLKNYTIMINKNSVQEQKFILLKIGDLKNLKVFQFNFNFY